MYNKIGYSVNMNLILKDKTGSASYLVIRFTNRRNIVALIFSRSDILTVSRKFWGHYPYLLPPYWKTVKIPLLPSV